MRAFTIFSAALALATSINAAAVNKRDVTAGVQACIDSLLVAQTQLNSVSAEVSAFTSAAGYSGALAVHADEQVLETKLKAATTACCAVTTTVSDEDANAVLTVVADLVPDIEATISVIVDKKAQFDAILLATALVKNDLKNLRTETSALDTCLVAVAPASVADDADAYVARVDAAFAAAATAYGF